MLNSDNDEVFSFANDERKYVSTPFGTENDRSPLVFEHGICLNKCKNNF